MDGILQPLVSLVQDLLQPFVRDGTIELHAQAAVLLCALVGFGLTSWLFRRVQAPTKEDHVATGPEAHATGAPLPARGAAADAQTTDLGDGGAEELAKKLSKVKKTKKGKETSHSEETEELIAAASSAPPVASAPRAAQAPVAPGREAPLLVFAGGRFSGSGFVDLRSPPHSIGTAIGGPMSVSFVARWDALNTWSRIFDFSCGPVSDNVTIANYEKGKTLVADVYRGTSRKRLLMTSAITTGEVHRYLFTVSASGRMRMLRDGAVLGELAGGYVPREVERTRLYVGGSSWANDGLFQGCIANLCVWRGAIEWDIAFPADTADLEELEALPQVAAGTPSAGPAAAAAARHAGEAVTAAGLGAPASQPAQSEEEMSERVAKLMAKKAERKARKAREKTEEDVAEPAAAAPEDVVEEERAKEVALVEGSQEETAEPDEAPVLQPEAAAQESSEPSAEMPPEELPSEELPERISETEVSTVKQAAPWRRVSERSAAWADLTEASEEAADADLELPSFAPEPMVLAEEVQPPVDRVGGSEIAFSAAQAEECTAGAAGGHDAGERAAKALPESQRRKKGGPSAASLAAAELHAELAAEEGQPGSLGEESAWQAAPTGSPATGDGDFEVATSRRRGGRGRGAGREGRAGGPGAREGAVAREAGEASPAPRAAPEAAAEEPNAASRTPLEREILKWEKKLREVERLKQRLADGEVLEPLQEAKLTRSAEIEQRVSELHAQRAAEQAVPLQMEDDRIIQMAPPEYFGKGGGLEHMSAPLEAHFAGGAGVLLATGRTPLRPPPPGKEQWMPSGGGACLGKGLPLQWTAAAMRAGPQGPGAPPEAGEGAAGPGAPAPQAYMPVGTFGGYPGGSMASPGQEDADGHPEGGFDPMCQQQFFAPVGGCPGDPQAGFDPAMTGAGLEMGMEGAMMQVPGDAMPMEFVYPPPDVQLQDRWECCWEWVQTGWCPRGLTCRWEHPPLQPMGYAVYE